jgi:hypothetical protein
MVAAKNALFEWAFIGMSFRTWNVVPVSQRREAFWAIINVPNFLKLAVE